jgi:hypothetical protein
VTSAGLRLLAAGALAGGFFIAQPAFGQQAGPSSVRPGSLRAGDQDGFSGFFLTSPIRLSLEGAIAPKASLFPQCATLEDDVGNSVGGIPVQHSREFWLPIPRLVLSLFTQLGCPIDAGIGAALAYSVPLRDSLALVFSGGMYVAPAQTQLFGGWGPALAGAARGRPSSADAALRTDVMWKTPAGPSTSLGVESLGTGVQSVRFSRGF